MLKIFVIFSFLFVFPQQVCYSQGFSANWLNIMRLNNGKYRVIVKYTHLRVGEYREAYIDFTSKKEAIDVFQKLVLGADFYWGPGKSIHFHKQEDVAKPY
jgi:hypothetical protein